MTNPEPSRPLLRARLRLWFLANPDDTLTAPDAAAKFGVHVVTASVALRTLQADKLIDYADGRRRRPAQYALRRAGQPINRTTPGDGQHG